MNCIPIELWVEILTYLDLPDLKHIRLISPYLNAIATPVCFATIRFDLRHNVDRIIKIASEELARHVRKLVLQTTPLLRKFDSPNTWERGIALPGDPDVGSDAVVNCDEDDCLMSYEEWSGLSDDQKIALYEEYEVDRRKERNKVRDLTGHLYFRKFGCARRERVHPERTSSSTANEPLNEASTLEQFDEAIKKFSNLAVLTHEPGFMMNYELSSRWRRLRFNLDILATETFSKEDEDMEALQLSIVLRALGWAECKLSSMDLYVGGPAFWGSDRLRRLWQGEGHEGIRTLRKTYGDAVEADKESCLECSELSDRRDWYTKQLAIMEYALINLTHLDWSISEEEDDGGLLTATGPLFEFLCCCEKLERARLVFGRLVDGGLCPGYEPRSHGDGPGGLLALLSKHTPWLKLRDLELEIVTDENSLLTFLISLAPTLRNLALSNATLLPSQGTWESTVFRIAGVLQLDSLKLSNICDYNGPQLQGRPQRQERIMFKEDARTFDDNQLRSMKDWYRKLLRIKGNERGHKSRSTLATQ
jgi:hypothetical protein